MSTAAVSPARASGVARTPDRGRAPSLDVLLGLGLAAALVAIAMVSAGGVDSTLATSRNTWTEIAVTVTGAAAVCALLIAGPRGRRWGVSTVILMAALTVLQSLSFIWSFAPYSSWLAASQAVSYLAAFAAAMCVVRLAPGRWPALLGGVAVAMTALSVWSLLVKVFPATLAATNTTGRLQAPFGYWNAIGMCASLGLPACLWAGARVDRGRLLAGLSAPALSILLSVDVLSYSRSADAAGAVGIGLWLVFAPVRLRSLAMLAIGTAGAAVIGAWMLTHGALAHNGVPLGTQDHSGHTFGIVILAVLLIVTAAGLYAARTMDRVSLTDRVRRRIGAAFIALLLVGVLVAIGGLAASSRGLTGQVSHGWHELTASNSVVSASSASRVFEFGSSRPVYWHEAIKVGQHNPLIGVGALGFGVARLRYTTNGGIVGQAHSYVFETFADLGVVGLLLTFALLVAWLVAAARPLAVRTRWSSLAPEAAAERLGMTALATTVVAFGVQSTIDWTWYFSGVAVPALLYAGWLAGRGPLLNRPRTADRTVGTPGPDAAAPGILDRLAARPAAAAGLVAVVVAMLLIGWMQWRPLESAQQLGHSESVGTTAQAFSAARAALSSDPLSIEPLSRLSSLYGQLHDVAAARAELVKARDMQPNNPITWFNVAEFDYLHGDTRRALRGFTRVLELDHTPDTAHETSLTGVDLERQKLAAEAQSSGAASG